MAFFVRKKLPIARSINRVYNKYIKISREHVYMFNDNVS